MRDPHFWEHYNEQRVLCDCCDIFFFKTTTIILTVLTTITGAVVFALSLVILGSASDELGQYTPEINRIIIGMLIIGSVVICLSILGCLATSFESSWFTVVYVMILVMSMGAQLSCGLLTIFLRESVREWTGQQEDCQTCEAALALSFKFPFASAVLFLVTIVLQLVIIAALCQASAMRKVAKREFKLSKINSQYSPSKWSWRGGAYHHHMPRQVHQPGDEAIVKHIDYLEEQPTLERNLPPGFVPAQSPSSLPQIHVSDVPPEEAAAQGNLEPEVEMDLPLPPTPDGAMAMGTPDLPPPPPPPASPPEGASPEESPETSPGASSSQALYLQLVTD